MNSQLSMPYHLRTCKTIERSVFCSQLMAMHDPIALEKYTYIGFGGPFLQDFKSIRELTKIKKYISIEANPKIIKRQLFNEPFHGIELKNLSSGDFISQHEFEEPTILWLDYSSPQELSQQLGEIEAVSSKLCCNDILKVTLNCNIQWLQEKNESTEEGAKKASAIMNDYIATPILASELTPEKFSVRLANAITAAVRKGIGSTSNLRATSFSCFRYRDGQQMMTLSLLLHNQNDKVDWLAKLPNSNLTLEPSLIEAPELSLRERTFIEKHDGRDISYEAISRYMGGYLSAKDIEVFYRLRSWMPQFTKIHS